MLLRLLGTGNELCDNTLDLLLLNVANTQASLLLKSVTRPEVIPCPRMWRHATWHDIKRISGNDVMSLRSRYDLSIESLSSKLLCLLRDTTVCRCWLICCRHKVVHKAIKAFVSLLNAFNAKIDLVDGNEMLRCRRRSDLFFVLQNFPNFVTTTRSCALTVVTTNYRSGGRKYKRFISEQS